MQVQNATSPQFTGFFNSENFKMSKNEKRMLLHNIKYDSELSYDELDVAGVSKFSNNHRLRFMSDIASRFRKEVYEKRIDSEETELIMKLYNMVEDPQRGHSVVLGLFGTEQSVPIFEKMAENNSAGAISKLATLEPYFHTETEHGRKNYKQTIIELAVSPSAKEIDKNFPVYEPYFKLNANKRNIVPDLHKEIIAGTYDYMKTLNEYKVDKLQSKYSFLRDMDIDLYDIEVTDNNKYSVLNQLGETFTSIYTFSKAKPQNGKDGKTPMSAILNIVNSTTDKNVEFRCRFLRRLMYSSNTAHNNTSLEKVEQLFDKVGENKSLQKCVLQSIDDYGFPRDVKFDSTIARHEKNKNFIKRLFS